MFLVGLELGLTTTTVNKIDSLATVCFKNRSDWMLEMTIIVFKL